MDALQIWRRDLTQSQEDDRAKWDEEEKPKVLLPLPIDHQCCPSKLEQSMGYQDRVGPPMSIKIVRRDHRIARKTTFLNIQHMKNTCSIVYLQPAAGDLTKSFML